ncbi:MAG TPA: CbiX/SirB N-terminal domain-containing protein [Gammaproteobacteria bacterium]
MRALILVAHGSRDANSNQVVLDLAGELADRLGSEYDCVRPAFLEFAEPEPDQAIAGCVECGVDQIVVLPYFLAPGRHVTRDVPALLARVRSAHPQVEFELLPYAGSAPQLAGAIGALARSVPRPVVTAGRAAPAECLNQAR